MFGFNALGALPPAMAQMLPYASLALGGGNLPSQPNPNAGGQAPIEQMGAMPRPSLGMFGNNSPMDFRKGPMTTPPIKAPTSASEAAVQHQQGIDVLGQGPIGNVDQFGLGRDLANLSHVDPIKGGGPNWQKIGQVIQAGLAGYLAARGNPAGMALMQQNFAMMRDRQQEKQRLAELYAKRYEPQSVGGSLVQLQADGSYKTLYDAPQAFERYAMSQGLQPGTPEFAAAVQDYRLGSWSDPAMEAKANLEGIRYGYRDQLQDQRLDVTRRGQDLNHQDRQATVAQSNTNNLRSTGTSRENSIRSAETTRGAYSYTHGSGGRGGKGGGSASGEGQIIVNPSTGQRMQLKGGQWVPIK